MKLSTLIKYNNNNNIVICKAHKVSSNAESEAPVTPAIARWTALVAAISPSRISSSYLLLDV